MLEQVINISETQYPNFSFNKVSKKLYVIKDTVPYAIGSLFAGIGGIELAFEKAGFKIKWANEIDKKACITYRKNFSHNLIEDDIKNLDPNKLEKVEILVAGFPCQAFSIAGYRKGFRDDRGNLFFEILRFIDSHQPKILFLENVKNLKTHNEGQTFKTILKEIEKRGYYTKYKILNTCEYSNIPQNRERIYIYYLLKIRKYMIDLNFLKK